MKGGAGSAHGRTVVVTGEVVMSESNKFSTDLGSASMRTFVPDIFSRATDAFKNPPGVLNPSGLK